MGKLQISDWIQVLGIISSVVMSAIALWVSYKSNKIAVQASIDNNRMIEETLRPEVTLYPVTYLNSDPKLVLIVKNIGSSTCSITRMQSDFDFIAGEFYEDPLHGYFLSGLLGTTLGPGQSKLIHLNRLNIPDELITFTYTYSSSIKSYEAVQFINFKSSTNFPITLASTKNKELEFIYHTLLEMFWKSL